MKLLNTVALPLLYLAHLKCAGQDTLRYCRENSSWAYSCFYFYKPDKQSVQGTFEKQMTSDDGQHWYGNGVYTEYKNKIVLDPFKLTRTTYSRTTDSIAPAPIASDTAYVPTLTLFKNGPDLYQKLIRRKRTIYKRI